MVVRWSLLALPAIALTAAACSGATGGGDQERTLAGTDLGTHSVALEEIHFDTFDGGSIPLSEISEERLTSLRDVIPPLDSPRYVTGGGWLEDSELVIGYATEDGRAWAFPVKILNFHEIVNDELGGIPVLVTYCPLCRSGVVYSRRLDGRTLTFGNTSALYENDLVMYDRQTGSYWWQVAGEAIVGELTGKRLSVLPAITATWSQWRDLHPDTLILSQDTGFARSYDRDPFSDYADAVNAGRFPFPVSDAGRDARLMAAEEVLGVTVDGDTRAYPLRQLGDAAVNGTLAGQRIVVFSSAAGPAGAAFRPDARGHPLTFTFRDGSYVDNETDSVWEMSGQAVAGPLKGERLDSLPTRYTFWFAFVAAFPQTDVYLP